MGADRDWMKPTSEYAEDWRSPKPKPKPRLKPAATEPMVVRVTAPSGARWVLYVSMGFALGFGFAVILGLT